MQSAFGSTAITLAPSDSKTSAYAPVFAPDIKYQEPRPDERRVVA
jgi:hypothetical protein